MKMTLMASEPAMDLLVRSNVVCKGNMVTKTNKYLYLALNNLVQTKPNWVFVVIDSKQDVATGFEVMEDGEVLGVVTIAYKGSNYRIRVDNDRVSAKRERGRGYYTEDPSKAELCIRKTFFRMDKNERLVKAAKEAEKVIDAERSSKNWEVSRLHNSWRGDSQEFVTRNISAYLQEFPKRKEDYDKWKEAAQQHHVMGHIEDLVAKNMHTLVVLDGPKYIMQTGDSTVTHTADSLSESHRTKLGLLKLVNDKQMISGVGCRVNEFTFVLIPDELDEGEQK